MPTVSYEYVPNTIVDALNEVHQKLNDSEVKYATTVTDALNNISVDLGGARHLRAPEAIKDIGEHLSSGGGGSDDGEVEYDLCSVTIKNIGYNSNPYGSYVTLKIVSAVDTHDPEHSLYLQTASASITDDPDSPTETQFDVLKGFYLRIEEERSVYNATDVRIKVLGDSAIITGGQTNVSYGGVIAVSPAYSATLFVPSSNDLPVTLIVGSSWEEVYNYTDLS